MKGITPEEKALLEEMLRGTISPGCHGGRPLTEHEMEIFSGMIARGIARLVVCPGCGQNHTQPTGATLEAMRLQKLADVVN